MLGLVEERVLIGEVVLAVANGANSFLGLVGEGLGGACEVLLFLVLVRRQLHGNLH